MNTTRILTFLSTVFLTFTILSVAVAKEPIAYNAPENVRKFADFLYTQADYLRAAGEYQRYLFFLSEAAADAADIRYRIALCYRFAGQADHAIQSFQGLVQMYPGSLSADRAYYQIGATYFLTDQFQQSARFLRENLPLITDEVHRAEAEQLIGLSYLMQKEWTEAGEIFEELQDSGISSVRQKANVYHAYTERGGHLPTRSPLLAGVLSTVVPGAGRLYTGQFGDALTSLLLVGLMGWQTYDGFQRDGLSSVKGWTFGTLGSIFYIGNIYGSVLSARVYNDHLTDAFLGTLSIEVPY